jgi:hypothetical protein
MQIWKQGGFWGAVGALLLVALVATLTRSGSQAPQLASSLAGGGAQLIGAATGTPGYIG